jgi:hypothetical protein
MDESTPNEMRSSLLLRFPGRPRGPAGNSSDQFAGIV